MDDQDTTERANNSTADPEKPQKNRWDTIERVVRTLSVAAIPIVVAVVGWLIQQRLQDQTIKRDYVQLAVSILKEPEAKLQPEMRDWAAKLLNENSPTKFDPKFVEQLSSGAAKLPESYNITQASAPATVSATGSRGEATTWEQKGFDALASKDLETAIDAFTNAEQIWPTYHNVSEIRKLLEDNRTALAAAPKEVKSDAWTNVYRTLLSKYSWGMPPDIKAKINAQM